jgi:hypothetical protein
VLGATVRALDGSCADMAAQLLSLDHSGLA